MRHLKNITAFIINPEDLHVYRKYMSKGDTTPVASNSIFFIG